MRLIELVRALPDKPWDERGLGCNPNVTMEDIISCPERGWNWYCVGSNPNLTASMMEAWQFKPGGGPPLDHDLWDGFSRNPNVTMDMVLRNRDKYWDWVHFSRNPNVTMHDISSHPHERWDWRSICDNPNLTIDIVEQHYHAQQYIWDWNAISRHANISPADVARHPDWPWSWTLVSCKPTMTMQNILDCPESKLDWAWISRHANITIKDVLAHRNLPWNWYNLSINPHITIEDVLDNLDLPWRMDVLASNPNFRLEHVFAWPPKRPLLAYALKHPWQACTSRTFWKHVGACSPSMTCWANMHDLIGPWQWSQLSQNPGITMDNVRAHPDEPWNWAGLSRNPNVRMKDVCEFTDKTWDWTWLSQNKHMTMEDILEHADKPWCWTTLSEHPNLTIDGVFALAHKPWDWSALSRNTFGYDADAKRRQVHRTRQFKEELVERAWHPDRFLDWCVESTAGSMCP
jgi:hypothetical protein